MGILVSHLLQPRLAHVSLRGELLVLALVILGLLNGHSVGKTLRVQVGLVGTLGLTVFSLVLQLVLEAVVLPVDFALLSLAHLVNDLLRLLRAKVGLVVLLVVVFVFRALLTSPVHLHVDEFLILLLVDASLRVCFPRLVLLLLDRVYELSFLGFTELL